MIDINTFLLMVVFTLSSILLVVLIVLGIKLINTIAKIDSLIDNIEQRVKKFDNMFNMVDIVTDSMAAVSDKLVDAITFCLRKLFLRKKEKEDDNNE